MSRYRIAAGLVALALLPLPAPPADAQGAGSQALHLQHADRDRTYRLYRPASLSRREPVPLVVMLHGGFGNGAQAERAYGWNALADSDGFVVAYPDGINRSWNAGGMCCGPALREQVDDVGFLSRLIEVVMRAENIDRRRLYIAGMSNGAAMAYRLACEASVPLAAIGPVAGTLSAACPHRQPVSVLAIHGLADRNVPFAGGQGTKGVTQGDWLPVEPSVQAFRDAAGCGAVRWQQDGSLRTGTAHCEKGRSVVLMTIDGAGHQWPGRASAGGPLAHLLPMDPPSNALDATRALWDFFREHAAPP